MLGIVDILLCLWAGDQWDVVHITSKSVMSSVCPWSFLTFHRDMGKTPRKGAAYSGQDSRCYSKVDSPDCRL